jgi:DNA-binding NarL/FixJ family response regulator
VARLLAAGIGDKQAAFKLDMAIHTLREQKRRIFDKLGVRSTKDLGLFLAAPQVDSGAEANPGSPPRQALLEFRTRAETLLARLIGAPGSRSNDPRRTVPREAPIATELQESWKCLLRVFLKPAWTNLTPREWEVACLAACGLARKDIAEALGISWHTVKAHLTPALDKLGAASCEDLLHKLELQPGGLGSEQN